MLGVAEVVPHELRLGIIEGHRAVVLGDHRTAVNLLELAHGLRAAIRQHHAASWLTDDAILDDAAGHAVGALLHPDHVRVLLDARLEPRLLLGDGDRQRLDVSKNKITPCI